MPTNFCVKNTAVITPCQGGYIYCLLSRMSVNKWHKKNGVSHHAPVSFFSEPGWRLCRAHSEVSALLEFLLYCSNQLHACGGMLCLPCFQMKWLSKNRLWSSVWRHEITFLGFFFGGEWHETVFKLIFDLVWPCFYVKNKNSITSVAAPILDITWQRLINPTTSILLITCKQILIYNMWFTINEAFALLVLGREYSLLWCLTSRMCGTHGTGWHQ